VGTLHIAGGLFGNAGDAVAALTFSIPPTRWSEEVLELSRLVRAEQRVPLTLLIGLACRTIKRLGHWDLLVSFADKAQGHHGGVYRAASWHCHGERQPRMDGIVMDGEFIPGRSCNSLFGTRSPGKLQALFPFRKIVGAWDEGKVLYWKALNTAGAAKAERLGLKQ
jgi:hypothetical protein